MKKKSNNLFWGVFAFVFIAIFAFWILSDDTEHIEDINGTNNYALNTITKQDIINDKVPGKNLKQKKSNTSILGIESKTVTFYSNEFSGIEEICYIDYILPSDLYLDIYDFQVTSGNFEIVIINKGKIIGSIKPSDQTNQSLLIENITGLTTIKLVGESAKFSFMMTQSNFDDFTHIIW